MEGETGVIRRRIVERHCWDIQRDQNEGEGGVSRRFIDELHSSDI